MRMAGTLALFSVLVACGDMDRLQEDGYRVNLVVNGTQVGTESAVLRSGDRVSPSFASIARDDPDLVSLSVSLRDRKGAAVGDRFRYVLSGRQEDAGEIAVDSFRGNLPTLPLPTGMELGEYNLIFEVFGRRALLQRTEITVLYVGNARFSLKDISMSLPGIFESQIVRPGTKVLLEARLDFDRILDPYLVWYSGRNIIHRGRVGEGAHSLLWEVPEETAFHTLRLEVLPFAPTGRKFVSAGIFREIVLPVSETAESPGFFFNPDDFPDELRAWYRFEGDLKGTKAGPALVSETGKVPRWTSMGPSYGLAVNNSESFVLTQAGPKDGGPQGGVFLLHFLPLAEGMVFSAAFPPISPAFPGAWLDLLFLDGTLVLRAGSAGNTRLLPVSPGNLPSDSLLSVSIKFVLDPEFLQVDAISDGETRTQPLTVELSHPLNGEVLVHLGGAPFEPFDFPKAEDSPGNEDGPLPVAIWDEFAFIATLP
ncbi:MAG: hypothetical protein FWD94_05545 [Treponema sp.]|nr:hypothetical protein [Treponema sp.]